MRAKTTESHFKGSLTFFHQHDPKNTTVHNKADYNRSFTFGVIIRSRTNSKLRFQGPK